MALLLVAGGCAGKVRDFDGIVVSSDPLPRTVSHGELVRRSAEAVAVIETDLGRGMGFVIDPKGYLITNRHVIEDASHVVAVRFPALDPPLEFTAVQVVYIDPERDLAVLHVPVNARLPSLPLATENQWGHDDLEAHDPVVVFKVDAGPRGDLRANNGKVFDLAVYNPSAGEGAFVGVTVDVMRGQSGGPVLDRYGRAVGVVTWTWKDRAGGYAIPIDEAARMLAERPQLKDPTARHSRAVARSREFLSALGRGDLQDARRLTSPSHAREVRERSMQSILGQLDEHGQLSLSGFFGAVDSLVKQGDGTIPEAELQDIVARTATPAFRELMGIDESISNGQVISLFFELGQSYLVARAVHDKTPQEALEDAMRRLSTVDAARTFAVADALYALAGQAIEIESVEVVPGTYSPSAVVSLRSSPAQTRVPALADGSAPPASTRLTLHLKLEWGDWYVASVRPVT